MFERKIVTDLKQLITTVFIEQPLASTESANYMRIK